MPKRPMPPTDNHTYDEILALQDGVAARAQLLAGGMSKVEVKRRLRRGTLVSWAPGVYLTGAGTPTWQQRAWASVLLHWPAALDRDSALRAENGPGWRGRKDDKPIQVAVPAHRSAISRHDDVEVRRVKRLEERVRWNRHPPRMTVAEATLEDAARRTDDSDRVEVLTRAVRSRMTTADQLIETLRQRSRIARRDWLLEVLYDVRDGTHSVLEHGYLVHVERAHGLPRADRQVRDGSAYRDASYSSYALLVELDGQLDHAGAAARASDLDRDLAAAAGGHRTVRLGWAQVFTTPCETAAAVGRMLQLEGWPGAPRPCGSACAISRSA